MISADDIAPTIGTFTQSTMKPVKTTNAKKPAMQRPHIDFIDIAPVPPTASRMAGAIYSDAQNSIARAFAKARLDAGLKQTELAEKIGKHQSYISDIERGQRRIDLLELFVIARALDIPAPRLYADLTKDVPSDFQL